MVALLIVSASPLALAQSATTPFANNATDLGADGWKLWLDRDATWKDDELFLPPVDLAKLPVHAPTIGWDALFGKSVAAGDVQKTMGDRALALDVAVPATVEQYYWDAISGNKKGAGTSGDYQGVSWWGRDFQVPDAATGKRIKLFFSEGARLRAEVYVNQKLVGYNLVEQLPFEVDVTDAVKPGANKLAVRITDPGGTFSWGDYTPLHWGKYDLPMSHGFGGILGAVQLKVVDPVHVADIYVKNKPTPTDVEFDLSLANQSAQATQGTLEVEIIEAWRDGAAVAQPRSIWRSAPLAFQVAANSVGQTTLSASVPTARLWEIRKSNLYYAVVTLKDAQGKVLNQERQRFGFRWFEVKGYGSDPIFALNGKRTFLLSAISWGYWPQNGIFPTPELARKHIDSALALGQNMLTFHRCVGNTQVLDMADEKGILYYEEPGAYSAGFNSKIKDATHFDFPTAISRDKLLRMVVRDRSHPSLVIYNMVNEPGAPPIEQSARDMADAHRLDPTRFISYGSGFMGLGKDEARKLHMLPNDMTQRTLGYADIHNAGNSPGVYSDGMYSSPTSFARNETGGKELFVWGEEGAIASPPQLEMIHNEAQQSGRLPGWDGSDYEDWYQAYANYIKDKGLEKNYPSITNLITSLGDIMYYEHGRLLENVRIADGAALYVLNGYEDEKQDNFSGAVDVYRHLKGHPELISQYMKPLLVSVKARDKIGSIGDTNLVDLFVLNEHAIAAGSYGVAATVTAPDGKTAPLWSGVAKVSGGDKFSDLVTEAVPVKLGQKGYYKINAQLKDAAGKTIATGHEEIFVVDWKSLPIGGQSAVVYGSSDLMRFLSNKKVNAVTYKDDLPPLDTVILGAFGGEPSFQPIPAYNFVAKDGVSEGVNIDYFRGARSFDTVLDRRVMPTSINFNDKTEIIPGYDILGTTDYTLRFEGNIVPDRSGKVDFQLSYDDGARLWFDGELLEDKFNNGPLKTFEFSRDLVAGKKYSFKIEYFQAGGTSAIALKWKLPQTEAAPDLKRLMQRVQNDGTSLLILGDADQWAEVLHAQGYFPDYKFFKHSKTWVGANYLVRAHPFFKDLPTDGAMNWEYQRLVGYEGHKNFGFYDMKGETPVVSSVGANAHLIATSMGILPYGKGKIVFSSLDLIPNLLSNNKAADVPRVIFCNTLEWAAAQRKN